MSEKALKINSLDAMLEEVGDEWEILAPPSNTTYNENRVEEFISHSKLGHSFIEIAAEMGINRTTFVAWAKRYPEFSHALRIGEQYFVAYWERTFRELANGEVKGNAQAAIFYAKNRLPRFFKDKLEMEHSGAGGIQVITNVPYNEDGNAGVFDIDEADYTEIEEDEGLELL